MNPRLEPRMVTGKTQGEGDGAPASARWIAGVSQGRRCGPTMVRFRERPVPRRRSGRRAGRYPGRPCRIRSATPALPRRAANMATGASEGSRADHEAAVDRITGSTASAGEAADRYRPTTIREARMGGRGKIGSVTGGEKECE